MFSLLDLSLPPLPQSPPLRRLERTLDEEMSDVAGTPPNGVIRAGHVEPSHGPHNSITADFYYRSHDERSRGTMRPRDVGFELFCLLLPRASAAAKVSLGLRQCDCGACGGCWRYTGDHDDRGHGTVRRAFSTRTTRADVAMWTQHHGPLAAGWDLEHVADRGCLHQDCCKLAHLQPVPPVGTVPVGSEGQLSLQG